jgi:hypothetical protein
MNQDMQTALHTIRQLAAAINLDTFEAKKDAICQAGGVLREAGWQRSAEEIEEFDLSTWRGQDMSNAGTKREPLIFDPSCAWQNMGTDGHKIYLNFAAENGLTDCLTFKVEEAAEFLASLDVGIAMFLAHNNTPTGRAFAKKFKKQFVHLVGIMTFTANLLIEMRTGSAA